MFEQSFNNSIRTVLWEESYMKENKNYWSGLTDNYIKVSTQNNNNIRKVNWIRYYNSGTIIENFKNKVETIQSYYSKISSSLSQKNKTGTN